MRFNSSMGPSVWEILSSIGTIGAAVFAGVAALIAASASSHARALVVVERNRDELARREQETRHARRIVVSVGTAGNLFVGGNDCRLRVFNSGADPVYEVMLRLQSGGSRWGPVAIGPLAPGQEISAYCNLRAADGMNLPEAAILLTDVNGNAWMLHRGGHHRPVDHTEYEEWEAASEAFATPDGRDVLQFGKVYGVTGVADYTRWHKDVFKEYHIDGWEDWLKMRKRAKGRQAGTEDA